MLRYSRLERAKYDYEQNVEYENDGGGSVECASGTHRSILLSDPGLVYCMAKRPLASVRESNAQAF